jgi:hypothetical protein
MNQDKRNKIPTISPERLDTSEHNTIVSNTKKERVAIAFVKEKEITQPFTIRIPIDEYQQIRRIAFDKDIKINQIIIGLIKEYIKNHNTP